LQFDKSKQAKEDAFIERRGKYESKVILEDMHEKEVKGKITKAENLRDCLFPNQVVSKFSSSRAGCKSLEIR